MLSLTPGRLQELGWNVSAQIEDRARKLQVRLKPKEERAYKGRLGNRESCGPRGMSNWRCNIPNLRLLDALKCKSGTLTRVGGLHVDPLQEKTLELGLE